MVNNFDITFTIGRIRQYQFAIQIDLNVIVALKQVMKWLLMTIVKLKLTIPVYNWIVRIPYVPFDLTDSFEFAERELENVVAGGIKAVSGGLG